MTDDTRPTEPRTVGEWLDRYWPVPQSADEGTSFAAFRTAVAHRLGHVRLDAERAARQGAADPSGLREALAAVESRHRQGDYTEDGWVGNSINGLECNGCGERWPCSATRLRAALSQQPAAAEPLDVERLAEAIHDAMCDISHHDRPPARCSKWGRYPHIALSVAPRYARLAATSPVTDTPTAEGDDAET